jgi:hypothetical protein
VRAAENCQHLATLAKIFDLRVRAREVAEQVQILVTALDQERDVAGDEPGDAVAEEETKIMPLNVRDQHRGARFGEGGRQIDHRIISSAGVSPYA